MNFITKRLPASINMSFCMEMYAAKTSSIQNLTLKYAASNRYLSSLNQLMEHRSKFGRQIDTVSCTTSMTKFKTTRSMTTIQNYSLGTPYKEKVFEDERGLFMATFPDVVRDLVGISDKYNRKETSEWLRQVLEYNLLNGKQHRGLFTVSAFKSFVTIENFKSNSLILVNILGWCIEMFHAAFLITDDVMDGGLTRRGQTCWYKLPNVGLTAINDSVMLENSLYILLKKHFGNEDCYTQLMELFHEAAFITACGQNLDLLNTAMPAPDFTMEKHLVTSINKTAYYSFTLPFVAAMHLAGIKDAEVFRECKIILQKIGVFYQIQDDFLDCYGNSDQSGKIGTDIQQNKCSWLAVQCIQRANEEQKQIMLECYGKNDPENIQKVIDLYNSMDLPKIYASYEEETYKTIKSNIEQMKCDLPREFLMNLLNYSYKRCS